MNRTLLKDKKVLVVGMGKSGEAAMDLALEQGAHVHIQDIKTREQIGAEFIQKLESLPVKAWLGKVPDDMGIYDFLILSPGVPVDLPFITDAKSGGAEIIGELELAYRTGNGHYIGITGTNGKTTTTTLVGEIFKAAGKETYIVGNIGTPVIEGAQQASDDGWLVTEISSFQLETTNEFRPEVSAILNLTPDHLNRHKTMENYGAAKARIFMRQNVIGDHGKSAGPRGKILVQIRVFRARPDFQNDSHGRIEIQEGIAILAGFHDDPAFQSCKMQREDHTASQGTDLSWVRTASVRAALV